MKDFVSDQLGYDVCRILTKIGAQNRRIELKQIDISDVSDVNDRSNRNILRIAENYGSVNVVTDPIGSSAKNAGLASLNGAGLDSMTGVHDALRRYFEGEHL
jgi:hypothetical protein